jgi:hypothetical protein
MSIEDDIRYAPTIDDIFEAKLKRCRREGHDLQAEVTLGGQEVLRCLRCDTEFMEVVA